MTYRTKAHLGRIAEVVGVLGAAYGIERVAGAGFAGPSIWLAIGILLSAVVIGLLGIISSRYYAVRDDNDSVSQRVALETLAKLGKRAEKQPLRPKRRK